MTLALLLATYHFSFFTFHSQFFTFPKTMNRYFIGFLIVFVYLLCPKSTLHAQNAACSDLKVTFSQIPINCSDAKEGTLIAVPEGGKPPYNYTWENKSIAQSLVMKTGDSGKVSITDANNCKIISIGELILPPPLKINLATENEAYKTAANGRAIANPSGGTAPYKVLWSSPKGFSANDVTDVSKLTVGSYTVAVYDAKWCTTSQTFVIGTNALLPCVSDVNLVTNTTNNILTITASTNTKKIEYIVDANNNGTFEDDAPRPYTAPVSADTWGLIAGTYNVQIRATAPNGNIACKIEPFDIIQPVLTSKLYATVGKDFEVYFENLMLAKDMSKFKITVETPVGGTLEAQKWSLTPTAKQAGTHDFIVKIATKAGKSLYTLKSTLCIAPADAGKGKALSSVLLGHSYVSGYFWTHDLYTQYFKGAENPLVTSCGSVTNDYGTEGTVRHDGIAATTWNSFINPTLLGNEFNPPNPYWGTGKLDIAAFGKKHCTGKIPDHIMVMLDLNDVYWVQFKKIADIDTVIDHAFDNADKFMLPIIAQHPDIKFAIVLIPPMADFMDTVKMYNNNTGFQTRQIGHRLIQRWIEKYDKTPNKNITLLPAYVDFDRSKEYDSVKFKTINDFHPSPVGYNNLAKSCFNWVKNTFVERAAVPVPTQDIPNTATLKIYPNPASDNIVVEGNFETNESLVLSLFDITGKQIATQKNAPNTTIFTSIDLSALTRGIYLLEVTSASGWKKIEKVVKM
jgi:Secretion system C-terminal sorting domain/SprB repeat